MILKPRLLTQHLWDTTKGPVQPTQNAISSGCKKPIFSPDINFFTCSQLRYGITALVINRRKGTDQSTYRRHGGVSVIRTLVSSHFLRHHASESYPHRRRGSCYQPWASGLQTRGSSPR